jgi:hypothetical protein
MRTFAEALTAIDRQIIQPARHPQRSELAALVAVGLSREFVSAVHDIVSDPAVGSFGADFSWAPGLRPPPSASRGVEIPTEARELLEYTASLLATTRVDTMETVSGPIVEVRHIPEDPIGSIAVQTVRNGRPAEVRITLTAGELDRALEWMRSGRTIIAEGNITRTPGHPLRLERPSSLQPLDERMLPQS